MFLKTLRITNSNGLIRSIEFRAGINLIVDETPAGETQSTGNNIGKTTALILIDFCLGGSGKDIYTDPENKKAEYSLVKDFLVDTQVVIELTLCESFEAPSERDLIIERNFLSRSKAIRRINGKQLIEADFERALSENLVPGLYGKKPTFPQIISHNIRYKDLGIINTLRTLDKYTSDVEYEALHLFLIGCKFENGEEKQRLTALLKQEISFKNRLENKRTRSAYEALLALELDGIESLEKQKADLNVSATLESDLLELSELKYKISKKSAESSNMKLRLALIAEAVGEIRHMKSNADIGELRELYGDVSFRLGSISKSFSELLAFHNGMIEEKIRYISKDIPALQRSVESTEAELAVLLKSESDLSKRISTSGTLEQLEALMSALGERQRKCGEYEAVIKQVKEVESKIEQHSETLKLIDQSLFTGSFENLVSAQERKFNRYFAATSEELYGETYVLKHDRHTTKTGQQVYKFSSFNKNMSTGKKQGEIVCFDIAYNLFADDEGIPCYHFLLNDKKELMHDNQLEKIANLVDRQKAHVQFVASILRDKLPQALNKDKYIVLKLSPSDKLFRIESQTNTSPN